MENASKALLIAAGMFFAILILSALVMFYGQVSDFYNQEHEATVIEQTQALNAKFEKYNRDNVRGSDLISLMNRVIDYNAFQSYQEGTNYQRIRVIITLGDDTIINQFKYDKNDGTGRNIYLTSTITNTTGSGQNWQNDKNLVAITNTSVDLCAELKTIGVTNPTDTQLQQLSSKISSIMVDEDDDWAASYRFKRAELIEDLLGIKIGTTLDCEVVINKNTGKTMSGQSAMDTIKNIASQYYQYTQFKRAHFDCTEVNYDAETNRIVEMNFELQTKNGNVVFDN